MAHSFLGERQPHKSFDAWFSHEKKHTISIGHHFESASPFTWLLHYAICHNGYATCYNFLSTYHYLASTSHKSTRGIVHNLLHYLQRHKFLLCNNSCYFETFHKIERHCMIMTPSLQDVFLEIVITQCFFEKSFDIYPNKVW